MKLDNGRGYFAIFFSSRIFVLCRWVAVCSIFEYDWCHWEWIVRFCIHMEICSNIVFVRRSFENYLRTLQCMSIVTMYSHFVSLRYLFSNVFTYFFLILRSVSVNISNNNSFLSTTALNYASSGTWRGNYYNIRVPHLGRLVRRRGRQLSAVTCLCKAVTAYLVF